MVFATSATRAQLLLCLHVASRLKRMGRNAVRQGDRLIFGQHAKVADSDLLGVGHEILPLN